MTTLREAAQQALKAMDKATRYMSDSDYRNLNEAITALKAALEQAEQTNPWRDAVDDELVSLHMVASDDPRESIRRLIDWHCAVQIDPLVSSAAQELIERGRREALEQPEQEPVATVAMDVSGAHLSWDGQYLGQRPDMKIAMLLKDLPVGTLLYTHHPRRAWQGLTEEEIYPLYSEPSSDAEMVEFARAIEAALRSKNYE
jgi:hypothetical protein